MIDLYCYIRVTSLVQLAVESALESKEDLVVKKNIDLSNDSRVGK